jgi:hypothetical protein
MFSLLSFRFIGAAVVAVILAALVGWHHHAVSAAEDKGYKRGAAEVTAHWEQERKRITKAALAASEEARQREHAYVNAVEATRGYYARESEITKAAAGRAARELERLRVAVSVAAVGVRPAVSGRGGPGVFEDPLHVRAPGVAEGVDAAASEVGSLLVACGGELQEVARVADELGDQVRGLHRHVDTLLERIAGSPPHAMPTT